MEPKIINTILFDLDGTLLPMMMDKFLHKYFLLLGKHLEEYIDPQRLPGIMMEATASMVFNKESISNQEAFMNKFLELVEGDGSFYLEEFYEFYDTLFLQAKTETWQDNDIIESVKILKEKGYNLVIATNPVFPMKANLHRIEWTGIDVTNFSYISSFEENHYCKPNLEFYREVLEKINRTPEECLMVGNDQHEDIISGQLGIKTYLITNCLISSETQFQIRPDYQGTYKDFLEFVKQLDKISDFH